MVMFSSKTLAERNNDPEPHWSPRYDLRFEVPNLAPGMSTVEHPRTQYQHGTLPANPILVHFRDYSRPVARLWVHRLGLGEPPLGVDATAAEVAHAHRVLSLLVALARGES